jgi:flagellar biogenesis protein FliO
MRTRNRSSHGMRAAWVGLFFLSCASCAFGAQSNSEPLTVPGPSAFFSLVRVAGALALVSALFFAGVWLFRNWQRMVLQKGRPPKLNLLEIRSMGARHALYVVGYEDQRFLLSSSPTGISLLAQLPSAQSGPMEEDSPIASANFADALFKAVAAK